MYIDRRTGDRAADGKFLRIVFFFLLLLFPLRKEEDEEGTNDLLSIKPSSSFPFPFSFPSPFFNVRPSQLGAGGSLDLHFPFSLFFSSSSSYFHREWHRGNFPSPEKCGGDGSKRGGRTFLNISGCGINTLSFLSPFLFYPRQTRRPTTLQTLLLWSPWYSGWARIPLPPQKEEEEEEEKGAQRKKSGSER